MKSEILSTKSETNSNDQNIKVQNCKPCRKSEILHSKFVSPRFMKSEWETARLFVLYFEQ
jgi:hypothetical protein